MFSFIIRQKLNEQLENTVYFGSKKDKYEQLLWTHCYAILTSGDVCPGIQSQGGCPSLSFRVDSATCFQLFDDVMNCRKGMKNLDELALFFFVVIHTRKF